MKIQITLFLLCFISLHSLGQTTKTPEGTKPFVLGYVDNLHSSILGEDRTLNIYLPEDYDNKIKYPVIYLLDGSADEDFIHVAGIVQYNTFSWINRIPKSIVIGIANTTNRKRDFTSPSDRIKDKKMVPGAGGSENFISFIEKELQPYITKKYNANEHKTIIGQSLGGLLVTEILFTKPQLFDKYIIISPSLWWNDGALLKENPAILEKNYSIPTDIYIAVGKEGSVDGSKNHIMEEDAKALANKIKQAQSGNINVHFDFLIRENHATIMHQAVLNGFRDLYPTQK